MWKVYLLEFIVVLIISIVWVHLIDTNDRNQIDRGDSKNN